MTVCKRLYRHLGMTRWRQRRAFPPATLAAIEAAIASGESRHGGQVRFAVEDALSPGAILGGRTAQSRAIEVFSLLRVWDTEHNNGVLVYVLLADRAVEIVADRGINARVGAAGWTGICEQMEAAFGRRDFRGGALDGIAAVTGVIATHFPAGGGPNELPDRPVLL